MAGRMNELFTLDDLKNWKPKSKAHIRLGVFGDPVAHSLSPQMQNAALENCGLAMGYGRFEIGADELPAALELLPELNFVGANLTVPHKIAAFKLMDEVDESARQVGAVNT